jgi:hypothetical protein
MLPSGCDRGMSHGIDLVAQTVGFYQHRSNEKHSLLDARVMQAFRMVCREFSPARMVLFFAPRCLQGAVTGPPLGK